MYYKGINPENFTFSKKIEKYTDQNGFTRRSSNGIILPTWLLITIAIVTVIVFIIEWMRNQTINS
jgi:hypothetical protein